MMVAVQSLPLLLQQTSIAVPPSLGASKHIDKYFN